MINAKQLREYVIIPALTDAGLDRSDAAVELLLMIAAHETQLGTYLKQVHGPALGIYQMEPNTYHDILINYIGKRTDLHERLIKMNPSMDERKLVSDLAFATVLARIFLLRIKEPIPSDLHGKAAYAKKYWNTPAGKATEDDYYKAYQRYVVEG